MRYDGCASVQFGDGAQVDREGEHDRLALAQTEIRRLDEDARGAQVHRLTKLAATAGNGDVDGRPSSMPRMQAAFHYGPRGEVLAFLSRGPGHYASVRRPRHGHS